MKFKKCLLALAAVLAFTSNNLSILEAATMTNEKVVQTAGRNALGEFAPEFAHYNDDVLFGENWNNQDFDLKTRS